MFLFGFTLQVARIQGQVPRVSPWLGKINSLWRWALQPGMGSFLFFPPLPLPCLPFTRPTFLRAPQYNGPFLRPFSEQTTRGPQQTCHFPFEFTEAISGLWRAHRNNATGRSPRRDNALSILVPFSLINKSQCAVLY